jgi:hypothetical protein
MDEVKIDIAKESVKNALENKYTVTMSQHM